MKIRDYTTPELENFIDLCNFTDDELTCFNLLAKDKSIVQIAREMHISTSKVSNLSSKIRAKIKRII